MYHFVPAGLLLDEALRACGATVIPTGPGSTDYQIEIMTKLGATGFVGTPSFLMILLDRAAELGIPREQITIRKALFSAEPYTIQQRMRFEGEYSMKTTSAYGSADLGLIAYTMEGLEGFCVLDSLYLEIVDPATGQPVEPGQTGEVVATTFNKGYPLVRFGTGDLGALAETPDPLCGGRQQLLGLYGRSGGAIKVRGMFLHPDTLGRAKAFFPQIKHLQAVITRPDNRDYVTVKLELHAGESGEGLPEMIKGLAEQAIRLRIDEVIIVPPGEINPNDRAVVDARTWE
jgi:phenylacetate-CoA ligase